MRKILIAILAAFMAPVAASAATLADLTIITPLAGNNVPGSPATITGTVDYDALLNGGAGGSTSVSNFLTSINGTNYDALTNVTANLVLDSGGSSGLLTFTNSSETIFSFTLSNLFAASSNGLPSGGVTTTNETSFSYNGTPITINGGLTGNISAVAAVPEPSTWALMLIGFGSVGVAMRRKRRAGQLMPQMA